jgi:site-specific recombinase XerD
VVVAGPTRQVPQREHTAATRLLRDGVPIEVVSKLLGHADITTTDIVYGT